MHVIFILLNTNICRFCQTSLLFKYQFKSTIYGYKITHRLSLLDYMCYRMCIILNQYPLNVNKLDTSCLCLYLDYMWCNIMYKIQVMPCADVLCLWWNGVYLSFRDYCELLFHQLQTWYYLQLGIILYLTKFPPNSAYVDEKSSF